MLRCTGMRLLALCLIFCFAANSSALIVDQSQKPPVLFEFHSGFWMNLHHFLYREAVVAVPQKGPRPVTTNSADLDELKLLSPEERSAWDAAVAYYQKSVIQHDQLFDA